MHKEAKKSFLWRLLGAGALRAGGFFTKDWSLPSNVADPLARAARARAPEPQDQSNP